MKAKNKVKMFAIMGLIALVAVGSTLAYLSSVTDTKENKFTSSKGITGTITEDEWTHDENGWDDYTPGDSTGKNPIIKIDSNDNTSINVRTAMKISCLDNNNEPISFETFKTQYAKVSYLTAEGINGADWEVDSTHPELYFYKTALTTAGGSVSTNPLFDKVTVNTGIKRVYGTKTSTEKIVTYDVDADGKEIAGSRKTTVGQVLVSENTKVFTEDANGTLTPVTSDTKLPSFQINITGYAVQDSDKDGFDYKTELRKLAGFTV